MENLKVIFKPSLQFDENHDIPLSIVYFLRNTMNRDNCFDYHSINHPCFRRFWIWLIDNQIVKYDFSSMYVKGEKWEEFNNMELLKLI